MQRSEDGDEEDPIEGPSEPRKRRNSKASVDSNEEQTTAVSSKEEAILASVVESDQLGPAIRLVFEAGVQDTFGSTLDAYVERKDQEIEEICNWRPQDFVSSVQDLLSVHEQAESLKARITELNEQVQATGRDAHDKMKELMLKRLQRRNLGNAVDSVRRVISVLQIAENIGVCIHQQKFYEALKQLDLLEQVLLPGIAGHKVADYIGRNIPLLVQKIKDACKRGFDYWLTNMVNKNTEIGGMSMRQTEMRRNQRRQMKEEQQAINAKRRAGGDDDDDLDADEAAAEEAPKSEEVKGPVIAAAKEFTEVDCFEEAMVDFTPVYQGLFVFTRLRVPEEFQKYYSENRQMQANVVLSPWGVEYKAGKTQAASFRNFFHQVAGFFIAEDRVMKTTQGLISSGEVDHNWDLAIVKLEAVLQQQLTNCTTTEDLLAVKSFLQLFSQTMAGYSYHVARLSAFLDGMRTEVRRCLEDESAKQIQTILAEDKWEQMSVMNMDDYQRINTDYQTPLPDVATGAPAFPRRMAFSASVPKICHVLKEFISTLFRFAEDLSDMDEYIRQCTDDFLIKCVNTEMAKHVLMAPARANSINLEVQMTTNLAHLHIACNQFEEYFSEFRRNRARMALTAQTYLGATANRAEALIFELVDEKINGFFGRAVYDWMPHDERKLPSEYMQDFMSYMYSVRISFANLPEANRQGVHYIACTHIANHLKSFIVSDTMKKFNNAGLHGFELDLKAVEAFAQNCDIPDLVKCFAFLRQLVNLLNSENATEFLREEVKNRQYNLLEDSLVLTLLEKYREDTGFRRKKSQKYKEIEETAKALKARVRGE